MTADLAAALNALEADWAGLPDDFPVGLRADQMLALVKVAKAATEENPCLICTTYAPEHKPWCPLASLREQLANHEQEKMDG